MPVKKSGARTTMQGAQVVRQPSARGRQASPRSNARLAAHAAGAPLGSAGEVARARMSGRGFLSEARDMARKVGSSASGLASGAREVASRTSETASQVAGKVRDNKWPALLIGAGATWLAIDAVRGRESTEGGSRRQVSVETPRSSASDAVRSLKNKSVDLGSRVGQFVRDNPVLTGATTLGVGVAVGMAMPATKTEKALLGDARQQMVRKAKEAARRTVSNVSDAAEGVQRLAGRREGR